MKKIRIIQKSILKYGKLFRIIIVGILLVICISAIWYVKKPKRIQARRIDSFILRKEPIFQAFYSLSDEHRIPLVFEEARPIGKKPENLFSLKLKNTTAKDVLNALTELDKNYYWEEKNGVINVMPAGIKKDKTYILNQTIDYLVVNNKTREEIIEDALKLLEPRYKEKPLYLDKVESLLPLGVHIELKHHSFKFRNKTLREILNKIARIENIGWLVMWLDDPEKGLVSILTYIEPPIKFETNLRQKEKTI